MLEQLFSSRTREKLLNLFLFNQDKRFFVREITRVIGERLNSVRRELANLERFQLINSVEEDRRKYYYLNQEFILLQELTNLFVKARLLWENKILQSTKKYEGIRYLSLVGFFVDDPEAKTDIVIVGRINKQDLANFIREIEKITNQPLRYTHFTIKEYNYRHSMTDRFLYNLLESKAITLIDKIRS